MGYYCTVPQCTSLAGKTKNVKFHKFPRDDLMAAKWNTILKRGKPYTKYSKVCSLHFTQADYNVTTMGQWKTLSKDAVPSLNLPKLNPDGSVMVIRKSRAVKYREIKKEDCTGETCDKWPLGVPSHAPLSACNTPETHVVCQDPQDALVYRYTQMNPLPMSPLPTHLPHPATQKPKKQDAIMQTDPVLSEDDDSQPNNSYSEVSDKSYEVDYQNYEAKDYTKQADSKPDYKQDYLPQTPEEYNKEAEKYALERKSHNGFEKSMDFQKQEVYQKESYLKEDGYLKQEGYQKIPELYGFEKDYQNHRTEVYYQNGYSDSVELLRNQQHNLQMLQEQHRITENQNFFNENHIKQEIDINVEDDKFLYDRNKEQLDVNSIYNNRRLLEQQRLLEQMQQQVKQEPDASSGSEGVQQPQGSPYYGPHSHGHGHSSAPGGYYEPPPRPGPELLIAKQNALAAHTQLWQNTMKRPFFYSETPHYNSSQLIHRYEDLQRILQ